MSLCFTALKRCPLCHLLACFLHSSMTFLMDPMKMPMRNKYTQAQNMIVLITAQYIAALNKLSESPTIFLIKLPRIKKQYATKSMMTPQLSYQWQRWTGDKRGCLLLGQVAVAKSYYCLYTYNTSHTSYYCTVYIVCCVECLDES